MDLEKIQKVEGSIKNLELRSARIYFLVQDTKGNPKASIKYIYDIAMTLKNNNYNPIIIHETKEYEGVSSWLDESYDVLPHQSIDGQNLAISPEDIIVLPELYGHVMEQIKNLPCGKIVLCQAYDHMFETLPPGVSWSQLGIYKCITTSEKQKEYISEIMKSVSVDILEPYIDEIFTKKEKPSKPIISIHTREPRDTAKIIKTFYLKYPQYRWITFRDMRGITMKDFSKFLKDSFLSVWVDNESAFGTYPLESMSSGTPVIATPAPGGVQDILYGLDGCTVTESISSQALAKGLKGFKVGCRMPMNVIKAYCATSITLLYEKVFLECEM